MKLNINNLNNKSFWENANIEIPKYDIKKVREHENNKKGRVL